ncbi:hypothetical protein [Pantoea stewartii]
MPVRRADTHALIAATAMQPDLILVTHQPKDVQGMSVMLLIPWQVA